MKILVCGSRNWTNETLMEKVLCRILGPGNGHEVVHGACLGADTQAAKIAKEQGWSEKSYPANWNKDGKRAGRIRNELMLVSEPDISVVIAFSNNIGKSKETRNILELANKHGYPVVLVPDKESII